MSDIYSLLNIKSEVIRDFPLLASRVVDHQMERVLNRNIAELKRIGDRMLIDKSIVVSLQSIDDVIKKVKRFSSQNDDSMENWTMRELRIVSYYMMKLRNKSKDYHFALSLLDRGWKNMYFNGLVFYLMNSWNSLEAEYREATSLLITKKLHEYNDTNKRFLLFKNYLNLFEKNGPMRMVALITAKKMNLIDAPQIIGFKSSAFKQSYYSDVIIKYIENNQIRNLDTIEEIFKHHDLDRTKKLVFANLVDREDRMGDAVRRSILCKFINRVLGDVTLASTWAPFAGATYGEAQKLKRAMKLVYMWFAQQIIEVFFEVCVQDRDRKEFWIKYVGYLSGFKIVGSTATKRLLQNDNRVSGMFLKHFIETNSYSSQTSALILFIKNKMIVEFSDTGALYVYNQNHQQAKLVKSLAKSINSTNDLKIPSMQMLVESYDWGGYSYKEEGKLHHRGYWQTRLANWMQRIVLSSSNNFVSFFETQDDDLFKETPLPEEKENLFEVHKKPNKVEKKSQTNLHPTDAVKKVSELSKKDSTSALKDDDIQTGIIPCERNISYDMKSKVLKNNTRIVANNIGFYIVNPNETRYARIKKMTPKEKPIGSIWIKCSVENGWHQIVHYYMGEEISIGCIKLVGDRIHYKNYLKQKGYKLIKFD